jgi:hypothetical protein
MNAIICVMICATIGVMLMVKNTKQESIFGGLVSNQDDKTPSTFVKIYEVVKEIGDNLTFFLDGATWNDEKNCLTVFNGQGECLGLFLNHINESWKGETDLIRLGKAIERKCEVQIASMSELVKLINESNLTIEITATESKEGFYRQWKVV